MACYQKAGVWHNMIFICCKTWRIPLCCLTWCSSSEPQRHWGDGGNKAPWLSIKAIRHLCTAAKVFNLLCGRRLSTSESHWCFMREKLSQHTADILSHQWPTCTVSLTCFLLLFATSSRIRFCLPRCIFISAEPCWYSAHRGQENMTPCTGSGKHDLTRVVERDHSLGSKHCCS